MTQKHHELPEQQRGQSSQEHSFLDERALMLSQLNELKILKYMDGRKDRKGGRSNLPKRVTSPPSW